MGHALPEDGTGRAPSRRYPADRTVINYPSGVTSAETDDSCTGLEVQPDAWRALPSPWAAYQVTRTGRVRSVPRVIECRDGRTKRLHGRELAITDGAVSLSVGGRRRTFTVGRLVRAAWGGEPR